VSKTNVTLTLPDELLLQARHLAVERGVSLSHLVSECLGQSLVQDQRWDEARTRALDRLKRGIPMGVGERPAWTRDALHDR
jgi:hypothetical protein